MICGLEMAPRQSSAAWVTLVKEDTEVAGVQDVESESGLRGGQVRRDKCDCRVGELECG